MFRIIYTVDVEEKESEEAWLRANLITPATSSTWNFSSGKQVIRFGMIVSPEQTVALKLRRTLDLQVPYRSR